jgi:hypothetical protein
MITSTITSPAANLEASGSANALSVAAGVDTAAGSLSALDHVVHMFISHLRALCTLVLLFASAIVPVRADDQYIDLDNPEVALSMNFESPLVTRKQAMDDARVVAFFDEAYPKTLIERMLAPGSMSLADPKLEPKRARKIHIVVRFDGGNGSEFVDVHLPSTTAPKEMHVIKKKIETFTRVLTEKAQSIARLGGMELTADEDIADILVHINLAENAEASQGFSYDALRPYPVRNPQFRKNYGGQSEMKTVSVLPWTYINWYEHNGGVGEIWIEYPLRTQWQEEAARILLDDLELADRIGVGATRNEIVQGFRTPNKTQLPDLYGTFRQIRPTHPRGYAGMSLLSAAAIARGPMMDDRRMGSPAGGPGFDLSCFDNQQLRVLSARLGRALAVFVGPWTMGALKLTVRTDEWAEQKRDTSAFLAKYSLRNFASTFDEWFADRVSGIVLKEGWPVIFGDLTPAKAPWYTEEPRRLVRDNILKNQSREVFEEILLNVTSDIQDRAGASCAGIDSHMHYKLNKLGGQKGLYNWEND